MMEIMDRWFSAKMGADKGQFGVFKFTKKKQWNFCKDFFSALATKEVKSKK